MKRIVGSFCLPGLMFFVLAIILVKPFTSLVKSELAGKEPGLAEVLRNFYGALSKPVYLAGAVEKNLPTAMPHLKHIGSLGNAPDWTAESNNVGAQFGISVANAGDVNDDGYDDVIVGASSYRSPGGITVGRAYLYYGSVAGLKNIPGPSPRSEGTTFLPSGYGAIVASGDVNGDGYSDVFVGAPTWDQFYGGVFLYLGSDTGIAFIPASTLTVPHGRFNFGLSLASAGDVNGDGYCDLLVGNPTYQNTAIPNSPVAPRALAYYGSKSGLSATPSWMVSGGARVSAAGDVNHDGFNDVIIDSSLYLGSDTGLRRTPVANWIKGNAASAGDINGDGFGDIIVGQPDSDRAYVFTGCDTGLNALPAWTVTNGQPASMFGFSAAGAGDVNKDGYDDIIIGAPGFNNGQFNAGRVYIFRGSATGPGNAATWTAESDQVNANFGWSLAKAGDVNGDGFKDAIIGAPNFSNEENKEGRAFVYHGPQTVEETLPLHLSGFSGKLVNNEIQLSWATTNEVNTCCFDIERSVDGRSFTAITRIRVKNNTTADNKYSFNDPYIFTDKIYYRIKIINEDGKFNYSSIAELRKIKEESWEINPSLLVQGQRVILGIQTLENKKSLSLEIIDISGKKILSRQLSVERGYQKFPISINIARGHYLVWLTGLNGQAQVKRITIE